MASTRYNPNLIGMDEWLIPEPPDGSQRPERRAERRRPERVAEVTRLEEFATARQLSRRQAEREHRLVSRATRSLTGLRRDYWDDALLELDSAC